MTQSKAQNLRAGPIHLKFADGELRYLYVGDKEIARRVYFAVRDKNWRTAMPEFTRIAVHKQDDGFTIDLSALCRSETADYSWQGRITGTPDGQVTFKAGGAAGRDFASRRIGICLLYGAGSLAGQAFETVGEAGAATAGSFPRLVSPTLVAADFQTLRYTTGDGMKVSAAISGTRFDMEDQRNYGDSSFKAYAPLAYKYPEIPKGAAAQETFLLRVENAPAARRAAGAPRIALGKLLEQAKVPRVAAADPDAPGGDFLAVNSQREKNAGAKSLTWGLSPSVHLPDEDNLMDNVSTIVDQVKTVRSFAPDAVLHIAPIRLGLAPSREEGRFDAAWSGAVLKYLALAGVEEAGFAGGSESARAVREDIGSFAGRKVYATTVRSPGHAPVEALAVDDSGALLLWLINLTDQPQSALWEGLPRGAKGLLRRVDAKPPGASPPAVEAAVTREGSLSVDLSPFEVCRIRLAKD